MGIRTWLGLKRRPDLTEQSDCSLAIAASKRTNILGFTCTGKSDGGGAQINAIMSAIVFAEAQGLPYFHTPLSSVAHGDNPKFADQWEKTFNLGTAYERVPIEVPVISGSEYVVGYTGPPAVVRQQHFHAFMNRNVALYGHHLTRWRSLLRLPDVDMPSATVAVHVRRGDVSAQQETERYTSNEVVSRHIEAARRDFPKASFLVFSEGSPADLAELPPYCEFHLNRSVFETLAMMIKADALVMAKSSLSYVCGLLSEGAVYYEPFWHKPMHSWKRL